MQLIDIEKARYRKHLNIVIAAIIGALVVGSLGISQGLIFFFPSETGTNFHWNLLGVVVSVMAILGHLSHHKEKPFYHEVYYVLRLKKELSLISRKIRKLEIAAEKGNKNAMLALQFSYTGSRQLWTLDDNMITMNALSKHQAKLDEVLGTFSITLDLKTYNREILNEF